MDTYLIFRSLTVPQWVIFSLVLNGLLFLCSIAAYELLTRLSKKNKIQSSDEPFRTQDLYTSLQTVLINSLVFLLGVILWQGEIIQIQFKQHGFGIVVEVLVFLFAIDFMMYISHYIAHTPFFYNKLHKKHHHHVHTNALSLFVLHPLESFGFGVMILFVLLFHNFSLESIVLYLFLNLMWGTLGHLNVEYFPKWAASLAVGTTTFHIKHHKNEEVNYGFYTNIWDRVFRTFQK